MYPLLDSADVSALWLVDISSLLQLGQSASGLRYLCGVACDRRIDSLLGNPYVELWLEVLDQLLHRHWTRDCLPRFDWGGLGDTIRLLVDLVVGVLGVLLAVRLGPFLGLERPLVVTDLTLDEVSSLDAVEVRVGPLDDVAGMFLVFVSELSDDIEVVG